MRRNIWLAVTIWMTFAIQQAGAAGVEETAMRVNFANGDTIAAATNSIDEVVFQNGTLFVNGTFQHPMSEITDITFGTLPDHLYIRWTDKGVKVVNPYFLKGVKVEISGNDAVVTNTNTEEELVTELSGETENGSFVYHGSYKTTIVLGGLTMSNKRAAAAIDIQCGKRVELHLKKGTVNTISDGAGGEQKAAVYCKGHLEIDKSGTLNVKGNTAHAISAKEYLKLKKSDGTINILGAVKDGLHCKQYFMGNGFNVNISNVGGDCIQAEKESEEETGETLYTDGYADGTLVIQGGNYMLKNTTNGSTSNQETNTAKGLKADGDMTITGGDISITMTGSGGKGIKVEGTYTQGMEGGDGPTLKVATTGARYSDSSSSQGGTQPGGGGGRTWPGGGGMGPGGGGGGMGPGGESTGSAAKAIKVMGAACILGGKTTITTATDGAEGLESKTSIKISGGTHYFKCYDDCLNSSGIIEFAGGSTVCYSNGNDAVDSNYGRKGAITISGGNTFAYSTTGSPEEGLDCDNNQYIVITGGLMVSGGGSQGGGGGGGRNGTTSSQSVGASSQGYFLGASPTSYKANTYYTLYNTGGEALCTYKFEGAFTNALSLLTAETLGKGGITIRSGTAKPTAQDIAVSNADGTEVFFVSPTVTATSKVATITAK